MEKIYNTYYGILEDDSRLSEEFSPEEDHFLGED